ncbi:MAG: hypothetical protein ACRD8U_08430 [Pyrinomonadaceae bacterium]
MLLGFAASRVLELWLALELQWWLLPRSVQCVLGSTVRVHELAGILE